jgi:alkylation response protein AidB-like acyl-CoA dehydrogenase
MQTEALQSIQSRATMYDQSGDWPQQDLDELAAAGSVRWAVPKEFGGDGLSPLEVHLLYEQIAAASLSTALILTQRDSAVGFLNGADGWPMREEYLRRMARNELFATIGIAQLTTSRQGGAPALRAKPIDGGFQLDGLIPWSTGPAKSECIFAGATLSDGKQILFALPRDLKGVHVNPPAKLVALRSSWTTQINLENVTLDQKWVIRGPVERVLAARKDRAGLPLAQSFLATGLCRGGLNLIATHNSDRARATHARFDSQLSALREEILGFCTPGREKEAAENSPRLRGACNDLALRISHAAVTLFKGTALLSDHPAQRLAREAMFLLVWSCPDPVIDCTVELLRK